MNIKDKYINHLKQPVHFNGKCRPRFYGANKWSQLPEHDITQSKLENHTGDIWVISDQHFGHKNIISFSDRPFQDIQHMESFLIEAHNDVVKSDDIVIIVGDFAFCNKTKGKELLDRLNGYKILIIGNHDYYHDKLKDFGYDEVYVCRTLDYNKHKLVFSHYPFESDRYNIHGHLHKGGSQEFNDSNHFNVNCEYINYTPINLKKILMHKIGGVL